MTLKAVMATRKRALELGAQFLENDLAQMREQARRHDEEAAQRWLRREGAQVVGGPLPLTSSLEGDLLKVMEWASAAATLRELARNER